MACVLNLFRKEYIGNMRQITIVFLLFFIGFVYSTSSNAQETAVYKNELKSFFDARDNYNRKNYALAEEQFRAYLENAHDSGQEVQTFQVEAAYYAALCSKLLKRPTATQELNNFIEKYGYHRKFNSLANFHLGDMYFANRKHRSAISAYEQVFIKDLFKEEKERLEFNLAYAHFNLKEFEPAQNYFEKAISRRGTNYYHANYYLGYMAYQNNDFQTALAYFMETEKDKRYGSMVPYYISQIYFQEGQNDKLLSYLEPRLKKRNIKYKEELSKLVGLVYYQRKNFQKALPYLETYVKNTPKVEAEDLYMMAYTRYQFGDYEKAIQNFSDLTTLENKLGQNALFHLADCYLKTNQKQLAKTAFESAARLNYDTSIIETSLFNSAKISFELSDFNNAVRAMKAFLEKYPNSKYANEAKKMLSKSFEQTNNYQSALETIENMANPTQDLKRVYQKMAFARALEHYVDGKTDLAISTFEKSFKYPLDNRLNAIARFWLGNIYYEKASYETSIKYLKEYLQMAGNNSEGKVSPAAANYTIGYIYFEDKDYKAAKPYFEKASASISKSEMSKNDDLAKIYPDAVLRAADCNFKERKYDLAGKQYQEIVNLNAYGSDYATFQQAMIAGLNQEYSKKIQLLQKVGDKQNSFYADDALFQLAATQSFTEDFNGAIRSFNKLISQHPKSKYKRKAQLDLGLAHYRLGNGDKAIEAFEKVIKQAPKSQEAQLALANIQNIYIEIGDSDGYFKYIKKFPNIQFSTSGQDTISYQFAETLYENNDCENAIVEFDKYLIKNPQGAFVDYAHYYRGECLFANKSYIQAFPDMEYIAQLPQNPFYEDAVAKSAYIANAVVEDKAKAYNYYTTLLNIASNPKFSERALLELTYLSFEQKKYDDFLNYSRKFLASSNYSGEQKLQVKFYDAKVAYERRNFAVAKQKFDEIARYNKGAMGAEARYLVAEILYNQGALEPARRSCYRVDDETPTQEYWRVKAFILIADIYAKENELFQATSTLQSIVDNFDSDAALLQEAKTKLENYKQQQLNASRLKVESESDTLKLDERY